MYSALYVYTVEYAVLYAFQIANLGICQPYPVCGHPKLIPELCLQNAVQTETQLI